MPWYVGLMQIVNTVVFSLFVYITIIYKLFFQITERTGFDEIEKQRLIANNPKLKDKIFDDPDNDPANPKDKIFWMDVFPWRAVCKGVSIILYLIVILILSYYSIGQPWAKTFIILQGIVFVLIAIYQIFTEMVEAGSIKGKKAFFGALFKHQTLTIIFIIILYLVIMIIILTYVSPSSVSPITNAVQDVLPK